MSRRSKARRKRIRQRNCRVIGVCIICVVAFSFVIHKLNGNSKRYITINKSGSILDITDNIEVQVDYLPENPYSRPGDKLSNVNGIVVHYVGNPGTTAENNRNYFASLKNSGDTSASSHFVIGLDGEIIQCIPLNEIAYASNGRNTDTIAIECCHPDESGEFTQATYDSLVKLTKALKEYYRLDQSDILRHYDVSGKVCPKYFVNNENVWEQFLDKL